jgi:hypothetical protein
MKQAGFLYFILILFGNILSTSLTMLISAKSKSSFAGFVIMTVITVLPMLVHVSEDVLWIYHLYNLIPVNMFYFDNITNMFSIDLFGLILKPYNIIISFAAVSSMVLLPFAYRNFKNHN